MKFIMTRYFEEIKTSTCQTHCSVFSTELLGVKCTVTVEATFFLGLLVSIEDEAEVLRSKELAVTLTNQESVWKS